jgi:Tol biopolymer transport system component
MSHPLGRLAALAIAGITVSLTAVVPAAGTSPGDNGRIAFRRYLDVDRTTAAIFTVRPDGTGERQVTWPGAGTTDSQPDWSPDGRLIGFERCVPNTVCAIYTVHPDGTQLRRLTAPCDASPPDIETKCPDESAIAFLPDGRHVVFTRSTGLVSDEGFIEHSDLIVSDLSERHTRAVVSGAPFSGDNTGAVVSPSGRQVAYEQVNSSRSSPAEGQAVFVVDLDGRHRHRITPWALNAGDHPDWSPNGRWILARSNDNDSFLDSQLYMVHPNRTGLRQVTHISADTQLLSASFSPDGRRIDYAQTGNSGLPDIFTMNTDGADVHQVTNTPQWDSAPDWEPRPCDRI